MVNLARLLRLPFPRPRRATAPRGTARGRARAAVAAMAVGVVAVAVVGVALIERHRLDAVDREYAARLVRLQRQLHDHPDRPLFLVVGSSRMVMGLAPEQLPDAGATVFNFSHLGSGPVMNHMTLSRLSREGVRPAWAVLEVMPGFLPRENAALVTSVAGARDVAAASRYYRPGELWWEYAKHRTVGLPNLARRATRPDDLGGYGPLGGCETLRDDVDPALKTRLMAAQERNFGFRLREFQVSAGSDRAIRDSVRLLREQGTQVRLLLSPEREEFTRLYGPGQPAKFDEYVAALSRELELPMTDARDWLAPEDFEDGHHALKRGAATFTARFGREVVEPTVRPRPADE